MIVAAFLLAGCQAAAPKKTIPSVSLEEAKKITATFVGQGFTPPPRTINDITAILSQEQPDDLKSYQKALLLADGRPPETDDPVLLAKFYHERANAAQQVGRAKQEVEDYRLAVEYGSHKGFTCQDMARWGLGTAELRGGNFSSGIQILNKLLAEADNDVHRSIFGAVLARFLAGRGDLVSAEQLLNDAEKNRTGAISQFKRLDSENVAKMDSFISSARGSLLDAMGRPAEGELYHRQAVAIFARIKHLPSHICAAPKRNLMVYNWLIAGLAENLLRQGRLIEAEIEARKALQGALQSHGRYCAHTAMMIAKLDKVIFEQGRYAEAEVLARANLEIYQYNETAADSASLAWARSILADAILAQKRWPEALAEYDAIRKALGTDPAAFKQFIARNVNFWLALIQNGRHSEARTFIELVFERKKTLLGEDHPATAETRGVLAMALAASGHEQRALNEFARALSILLRRSDRSEDEDQTQTAREFRLGLILDAYIKLLSRFRGTDLQAPAGVDVISEAFRMADIARGHAVKQALAAASARAAAIDPDLNDLARREQDALTQIAGLSGLLADVLTLPHDQQNPEAVKDLRSRIDRLRSARTALMKEIEARFPGYADLVNPKSLGMEEIRSSLRPGEALISTYIAENRSYVWAIPYSGQIAFASMDMGVKEIAGMVKTLRASLDLQVEALGDIPEFDLQTAYRLYAALLQPVADGWKDAKHLIVVAHGPLGYLPFSVLPTKPATLGPQTKPLFSNYRAVPWLARTHAVTVLPSAASLRALRSLPAADPGRRPFVGFGDPYFSRAQAAPAETRPRIAAVESTRGVPLKQRAVYVTTHLDSAGMDILPRLPDTADELKEIALALKADPERDVFLGQAASEGQVKSMDLSGIKILAFATHGLLPGDIDGLTQPALALTSPEVAGGTDDGLLTMGEILGLRLNADWALLSACNTGSGEGAGAEAVSGLGRAFFYAGTRAILVSNWPVETTSAKTLTTELFRRQAADPTLRRSEALNRTMQDLIDRLGYMDTNGRMVFSYAHPVFWAPFSLVGDGG
jgi:CHAT domain-containing protein